MIKLIILDFDDTLALTEEATFNMENDIAVSLGFKPMTRETHKATWGRPLEKVITDRIPGIEAAKFMQKLGEEMPKYIAAGNLDVIPKKNYDTMDNLIKAGKLLCVLTQRTQMELTHILDKGHPLGKRIKDFRYRENSKYFKPDPRAFDHFFQEFQVTPNEVVYVGDSVSDAVASKAANIFFIASLESGIRTMEDFQDLGVDYFINDFTQLEDTVSDLDNKLRNDGNYNSKTSDKQNELLIEVDEHDNLIGSVTRRECHNETRRPWHRTTHVYLFDQEGKIIFSKRSAKKDTAANKLTVSAGGHVPFGSDYEATAKRELQEELGVTQEVEMLDKFFIDYGSEREVIGIFAGMLGSQELKPNTEEVAGIESYDLTKVIKDFTEGRFDLSGGSRDSFKHLIKTGKLLSYWENNFN